MSEIQTTRSLDFRQQNQLGVQKFSFNVCEGHFCTEFRQKIFCHSTFIDKGWLCPETKQTKV